jgi:hypothetical protein
MSRLPRWMCGWVLALVAGCSGDGEPYAGFVSEQYADLRHWLCHPNLDASADVCASAELDATVVEADGSTSPLPHVPATSPEVDCFYAYPTISLDPTPNSDLDPGEEEVFITEQQAARYNAVCRVFAPVYRQVTLTALLGGGAGADREMAYGDVRDAFKHYVANHSEGRPFILIGHSQGAGHLRRLVADEIEGSSALSGRLIAAHLIGTNLEVPVGEDVGAGLRRTPLCSARDQTGCTVTFVSYRETDPPGEGGRFGLTSDPSTEAACTHPAALAGGPALLEPFFPMGLPGVFGAFVESGPGPFADPEQAESITTPFFVMPEFVEGECVRRDGFHYLEIRVLADAEDPRADDIGGDFQDGWGLHVVDMHLAMGDLMELARSQSAAWLSAQP